jgi:adenosylcobinamide-GDP ribazoletransferase
MPLVGTLVGAIAGASIIVAAIFVPQPLPTIIGLIIAIAVTGALHEDGLADIVDAFGGGRTRDRRLEIMKDSRIGTYGTLALISVLALKAAALIALDPVSAALVMIAGHAGARLAPVLTMWALPHAGNGNSKVSKEISELTSAEISIAVLLGLLPGLILLPAAAFAIATLLALAMVAIAALIAKRKIGGYTGDVLGAVEQIFETAFFVAAATVIAGPG